MGEERKSTRLESGKGDFRHGKVKSQLSALLRRPPPAPSAFFAISRLTRLDFGVAKVLCVYAP